MQNTNNILVLTSLSIPELRNIFRAEIESYFHNNPIAVNNPNLNEGVIQVDEAAKYIGLSIPSVYRLVNEKKLPVIKTGKKLLFIKKDLTAWLMTGRKLTIAEIERENQKEPAG